MNRLYECTDAARAENRQKSFFAASNGTGTPSATYAYDGEGRRVRKIGGSEDTIFVYDAAGRLAAEYQIIEVVQDDDPPRVSYLTNDHLGSPRIVTDANGAVVSRKDFAAFGDETITSHRTAALGYPVTGPDIRQDYTGYQKDGESGLEYAQARYYNGQHGRFTSVDPLTESATIRNPQSFNRYSYVLNSPYKFTDPLGLFPAGGGACGRNRCTHIQYSNDGTFDAPESVETGSLALSDDELLDAYEYFRDELMAPLSEAPPTTVANDISVQNASLQAFGTVVSIGKVNYTGGNVDFEVGTALDQGQLARFGSGKEPFFIELSLALSPNVSEMIPTDVSASDLTRVGEFTQRFSYLDQIGKNEVADRPALQESQSAVLFVKGSTRGDITYGNISGAAGSPYGRTITAQFTLNFTSEAKSKSASIHAFLVGKNSDGKFISRTVRINVSCSACR